MHACIHTYIHTYTFPQSGDPVRLHGAVRGGLPSRTHDGLHLLLHPDPHRRMEAVSGLPAAAGYIRPMHTYIHSYIHTSLDYL